MCLPDSVRARRPPPPPATLSGSHRNWRDYSASRKGMIVDRSRAPTSVRRQNHEVFCEGTTCVSLPPFIFHTMAFVDVG